VRPDVACSVRQLTELCYTYSGISFIRVAHSSVSRVVDRACDVTIMFLLRNFIYFNRYSRNMRAVYRHSESVGPDGYRILRYPDLISTAWYHTTLTYHGWRHVCTLTACKAGTFTS
jgi:hypothetical protein